MRFFMGLVLSLVLGVIGCSEGTGSGGSAGSGGGGVGGDGGASPFRVGMTVTVSGASPFADCRADDGSGEAYTSDSEVQPWLAVNPSDPDNMVAVWQQDLYQDGGGRGTVGAVSMDGGATWQALVVPGLSLCSGGPWLATGFAWLSYAQNGDLYMTVRAADESVPGAVGGAVVVLRSIDGGLSWNAPVVVDEVDAPDANLKPSITADPADPCRAYVAWTRYTEPIPSQVGASFVSRTTDCGETWDEPETLSADTRRFIGLRVVPMPDGSLLTFSVGGELRLLNLQSSTDQGDSWSVPRLAANVSRYAPGPTTPDGSRQVFSAEYLFDVGVDDETGHLYLVWEQVFAPRPDRMPSTIGFTLSTDGGLTWSEPIRIDQTPDSQNDVLLNQAFLPSIEVADNGVVGVTYYNFQNAREADGAPTDVWFVYCDPSAANCAEAASWSGTELRLTAESFDFLPAPPTNSIAMNPDPFVTLGDYVGLSSSGSDFFALFSVTTEDDPANVTFVPILER